MKKLLVFLVVNVLLFFAVTAFAESGPYCSLKLGAGWVEDVHKNSYGIKGEFDFDTGFALGVAAGYDFSPVRVDAEFGWQKNKFGNLRFAYADYKYNYDVDGDVTNYSFLLNAYYDFNNGSPITFILGAGAGTVYIETEDVEYAGFEQKDEDDWYFAYQVTAGVGYELNKKMTLEVTYRYLDSEENYTTHNAFVGLRYNF